MFFLKGFREVKPRFRHKSFLNFLFILYIFQNFSDRDGKRKLSLNQKHNRVPVAHACLASQMASCTDGIAPSDLPRTRPRRDMAKAFAAVKRATFTNCQPSSPRFGLQLLRQFADLGPCEFQPRPRAQEAVPCLHRTQVQGTSVPCDVKPLPRLFRCAGLCLAWLSHPGGVVTPSLCR